MDSYTFTYIVNVVAMMLLANLAWFINWSINLYWKVCYSILFMLYGHAGMWFDMHLEYRNPLVINRNPFFLLNDHPQFTNQVSSYSCVYMHF